MLPGAAQATRTSPVTLTCPVDQTIFEGRSVRSSNSFRGLDRDLCPHATGGSPMLVMVATCPKCGYSAPSGAFQMPISAALNTKILKAFEGKPAPTPHERWARHAQILAWSDAPALDVAEAWILAAWSTRLMYQPASNDQQQALLLATQHVGQSDFSPFERDVALARALMDQNKGNPQVSLLAAGVLRSRGENQEALKIANAIEASQPLADALAELRASIQIEQTYLERARGPLTAGARDKATPKAKRIRASYMAAELARRAGDDEQALELFERARKAGADKDDSLKLWIQAAVRELKK